MSPSIVYVVSSHVRPGGGPAGYVYNLCEGLREISHANSWAFAGRRGDVRTPLGASGLSPWNTLRRILDALTLGAWLTPLRAIRLVRKAELARALWRAKIIVIHGPEPCHLELMVGKFRGATIWYMPHSPVPAGFEVFPGKKLLERLFRRSLCLWEEVVVTAADAVVLPSSRSVDGYPSRLRERLGSKAIYLPSGAADLGRSTVSDRSWRSGRPAVLFAGRYVDHKGFRLYCETAGLARQLGEAMDFFSIGAGPVEPSFVHDLGWQAEPARFIAAADVVVVPSQVSYYDLLPLEACSLGVPVVATPIGGNIDQANDVMSVSLAESSTASAVLEEIRSCLARPHEPSAVRQEFLSRHSSRAMAERWIRAIETNLS